MESKIDVATLDFLRWVAGRMPAYSEAQEVWQTSCPRLSTWEDSFIAGFVRTQRSGAGEPVVVLTPLGESMLGTDSV